MTQPVDQAIQFVGKIIFYEVDRLLQFAEFFGLLEEPFLVYGTSIDDMVVLYLGSPNAELGCAL